MSEEDNKTPRQYYAVYFPDDIKSSPRNLHSSLKEAAKCANSPDYRSKGARFRRFDTEVEANAFYAQGDMGAACESVQAEPVDANKKPPSEPVVAFPSVNRVDMNKLKKIIETNHLEEFLVVTDINPRYLINVSSDTAAIVQEGFRFNALHISARNGCSLIAQHILDLISSDQYLIRLYGTNEEDVRLRKQNLIDSYINTPDKGNGDTPLHLAAKFGHVEVARIISSCESYNRNFRNKNGERAMDVICTRFSGEETEKKRRKTALKAVLNSYYVSLYRSTDHSTSPYLTVSALIPPPTISPSSLSFPSSLTSPLSPVLSIFSLTALAGPFQTETAANEFMKRWKSAGIASRRGDWTKGMEKVGRTLSVDEGVEWKETWHFYSEPIDIKSNQGLRILERHLKGIREGEERKEENGEEEETFVDADEELFGGTVDESWTEGDSMASLLGRLQGLDIADKSQEEEEEFFTPPSSPPPLFLSHIPCKNDNDVFEVLTTLPPSSLSSFPFIRLFISSMSRIDPPTRSSLPSLDSPRYVQSPKSSLSSLSRRPLRTRRIFE